MTIKDEPPLGRIEVITGCMFAGKTGEMLRRLRRADIAGYDYKVYTPDIDDRYGKELIGTHTGNKVEATVVSTDKDGLNMLYENSNSAEIVAVDEANFFGEDLVPTLEKLANEGKRVIVSGIDQTFRGEPFQPLPELMVISDEVDKRTAICEKCGLEATKTQRLIDGEPAEYDSPTVDVGADEKYEARCRKCHEVR